MPNVGVETTLARARFLIKIVALMLFTAIREIKVEISMHVGCVLEHSGTRQRSGSAE